MIRGGLHPVVYDRYPGNEQMTCRERAMRRGQCIDGQYPALLVALNLRVPEPNSLTCA